MSVSFTIIQLQPYASNAERDAARLYVEADSNLRTPFQRDRDRIIHSMAFRRLKHKTQVFIAHEGDHYRTRLTHSLEVAQIARTISRILGVDEDLAEALALAHDLGHTPFGHAGEDALAASMQPYGGFSHNEQTFRILVELEKRYPSFDGLNLSWACLEGVIKHNGPLTNKANQPTNATNIISAYIMAYSSEKQDLRLSDRPGLEAQIAAVADDIAYSSHDIDDGLRASLFTMDELADISIIGDILKEVLKKYPSLHGARLRHELVRQLVHSMVSDVIRYSLEQIDCYQIKSTEDIRTCPEDIAHFSPNFRIQAQELKSFLFRRMYRHYQVNRTAVKAKKIIHDLFDYYIQFPASLPNEWQIKDLQPGQMRTARHIADYIAGMTDRFALTEHRRLFDLQRME
jgi:dGTPase